MPILVHNGTDWQVASQPGGLRPYVHNGSGWQPVSSVYAHDGATWRLVYQFDATPPTSAAPTATRVSAGTTMTVSYSSITDSDTGVVSAVLQRRYIYDGITYPNAEGEDRHTIYSGAATPTVAGGSFTDTIDASIRKDPINNRDYTVSYRLKMVDAAQNIGYTDWSTGVQTKPLGTFTINATQTSTWETAGTPGWRTDTDDVVSGFFDSTYATQTGYWFYGPAVQSLCVGYTPASATIFMQRKGSNGVSGSNNIAPHVYATRPTTPAVLSAYEDNGPSLTGSDASATYSLPAGWLSLMGDGTMFGVAAVDSGGYRRLYGLSSKNTSGSLTIVFT